ncbi:monoglyceride lipase, putative [Entamoeba invadens IP1]|uniref:monoglyceride lipase, putative n=1 Tax=Entamoeba invadens IP1 TaxID=370355 RepID=UPI0002C3CE7B|nr:monoglyceride lipase, putative [Entamoeba invadens IP1]ELP94029.1 monoglyceride lipase, putative [Entamoeba invadens IP1]|eukprot:XP_004260800.1 monoglyceride lipase, putative [Entamoeba invadens IP1]
MTTPQYQESLEHINNFEIFTRSWEVPSPKAILFFQHGYGEHSGRYIENIGNYFSTKNYTVYMMDLPGHGKSSGLPNTAKTYIDSFETYITTVNAFIDMRKAQLLHTNINVPLFFSGHSMGGLITCMLSTRRNDITAFVAFSPALVLNSLLVQLFFWVFYILAFFFPQIIIKTTPPDTFFTNKQKAKDFEKDPLDLCSCACVKTSLEMRKFGALEKEKDVTVPMYLLQGAQDALVKVDGARDKSKHFKNKFSKYSEYPAGNHTLLEEDYYLEIVEDVEKWLDSLINQN